MAAGAWTLTNTTRTKILTGQFVSGDSYKVALFAAGHNVSAASTTYAALTGEVGTTNTGYTTGGIAVSPLVLAGTTSVTAKLTTNPVWTAGSANLAAQTAVLYEVAGDVLAFCNLDSGAATVTATSSNTLTLDGQTNPIFTLA